MVGVLFGVTNDLLRGAFTKLMSKELQMSRLGEVSFVIRL